MVSASSLSSVTKEMRVLYTTCILRPMSGDHGGGVLSYIWYVETCEIRFGGERNGQTQTRLRPDLVETADTFLSTAAAETNDTSM